MYLSAASVVENSDRLAGIYFVKNIKFEGAWSEFEEKVVSRNNHGQNI